MPNYIDELCQLFFHQLKGDALVSLNAAEHQSHVLSRKETLRNDRDQISAQAQRRQKAQHDERRPLQCPPQRTIVQTEDRRESALAGPVQPTGFVVARVTE